MVESRAESRGIESRGGGSQHGALVPLPDDTRKQEFGYGHGGVPFLLLLFYLAFLTFFTWYTLEYQLPDYLDEGPGRAAQEQSTRE